MAKKNPSPPTRTHSRYRGSRHLQLGLAIGPRSASVKSMWIVDKPAVQATHLTGPIYVRIDLGAKRTLLQALPDPRICRGVNRPKIGHYFHVMDSALMLVSAPFDDPRDLTELRVRILDATHADVPHQTHQTILHLFDQQPERAVMLGDFGIDALRKHLEFTKVAAALGWVSNRGSFEILVGQNGRFRWQLRRSDGAIMGQSAQDFITLAACEEDIRWVKANAASSPIDSRDTHGR